MKRFVFGLIAFLIFSQNVFAEETLPTQPAQTPAVAAYTNYRDCIKLYKMSFENLFYLALSAVNDNKFQLLEMQSRNGYLIFEEDGREFLLNVMKKDKNYAFLRLTPADNNYYFSPTIPQRIFNYVDTNSAVEIKELKI